MEAVPYSPDQTTSPYNNNNNNKHMKNPKRNARHFISRSSMENFAPANTIQNGLLFTPRPSSYSFPPPSFSLVNSNQQQYRQQQQQQQKKPPLLPLPNTKQPYNSSSLPSRTRGLSCSPTSNKNFSRCIKKSKPSSSSPSTSPKKEDSKKDFSSKNATTKDVLSSECECLIIASTNRLGPDPNDLPKDIVSGVLSSSSSSVVVDSSTVISTCKVLNDFEKFSGSVFTLSSPPPSSLPLPKFSVRPKLSCSAEAAASIDAGATDNLRRLLRLR